jgi:hypothetical protein
MRFFSALFKQFSSLRDDRAVSGKRCAARSFDEYSNLIGFSMKLVTEKKVLENFVTR